MLAVTPTAAEIIQQLVVRNDTNGEGGLRIAPTATTEGGFSLSVASAPEPDDQVVEVQEAEIFLEPAAADALDGKVLDATVNAEGGVSFSVAELPGPDAP